MKEIGRVKWLDALRGAATIGVILCHWVCIFYPGLYFAAKSTSFFEDVWRGSPLNIITNGDIGVQFFFVCSGLLITKYMYSKKIGGGVYKKEICFGHQNCHSSYNTPCNLNEIGDVIPS